MPTADQSQSRLVPVKYPSPVWRFTVRWDNNEWKIISQVRVSSMTLPAPDPLPAGEESRGFWIEATDGKGGIYQRQVMHDPLAGMEQFEEGGEISRIGHPGHQVSIEILLPDLPEVSELHLVSNSDGAAGEHSHSHPKRTVLKLSPENGGEKPGNPDDGHHHQPSMK